VWEGLLFIKVVEGLLREREGGPWVLAFWAHHQGAPGREEKQEE